MHFTSAHLLQPRVVLTCLQWYAALHFSYSPHSLLSLWYTRKNGLDIFVRLSSSENMFFNQPPFLQHPSRRDGGMCFIDYSGIQWCEWLYLKFNKLLIFTHQDLSCVNWILMPASIRPCCSVNKNRWITCQIRDCLIITLTHWPLGDFNDILDE